MKKRQMRMGMFDHAKYSRPVIRGMPDEILQEVRKELRTLLNGPEEATTSRKRSHEDANANNQDEEEPAESGNIMLPTHQRINILVPTPTGGNQPSVNVASGSVASMMVARAQRQEKDKKKTAKTVNPTLSQVRAALLAPDPRANKSQQANKQPAMKKGDLLPPRLMEYCRQNGRMMGLEAEGEDFTPSTGDGDSSGQQQEALCTPPQNPRELMLCTPPQRNRDDEQQQQRKQFHRRDEAKADNQEQQQQSGQIFPKKPPLKEIAAKLMESCPTITLRPDEPMTLADATFSLVRRALDAAKERSQAKKDNQGAAGCSSSFTAMEENPEITHSPYRAIANNTFFFDDQMEEAMAAKRGRGFFDDNNSFMAPNQPYLDESPLADLEDEMIFADSMLGSTTRADSRIDGANKNNNKQKQSRDRHFDAGASIPSSKSVRTFARNNNNNYEDYEDDCANSTLPRGDDAVFDERLMMGPSARPKAGNRFGNNSGNNNALQQLGFRPPQMRTRRFGFDFDGGGSQLGDDGGRGHQQQQQQGSSRQLLQQGVGGGNRSNQAAGGFVGGRSFVDQLQQQQQDITATSAASNDTAADDNDDGDGSDDGMMDQDDGNGNLTYF